MIVFKTIVNFFRYVFIGFYAIFYYAANAILYVFSFIFYLLGLFTKKIFNFDFKKVRLALKNEYVILAVALLIIFFGSSFLTVGLYSNYNAGRVTTEQKEVYLSKITETEYDIILGVDDEDAEIIDEPDDKDMNYYLNIYNSVIKIDSIDLFQGIVKSDTEVTTINKNVSYMKYSDLPSIKNGNFVLAAHSGTGRIAYFNNIHKLKEKDEIKIYYNKKIYTYIVNKNFVVDETNLSILDRIDKQTTITLITCKKGDNKKRVIIQGYLNDVSEYKKDAF